MPLLSAPPWRTILVSNSSKANLQGKHQLFGKLLLGRYRIQPFCGSGNVVKGAGKCLAPCPGMIHVLFLNGIHFAKIAAAAFMSGTI